MSATREHQGKEQEFPPKLDLTVTQVVASSLAAVSAAVASSKLGVGGTLMGAAAASVVATVGSAVYSHSIATTKARLRTATTLRPSAHAPSAAPTADAAAPVGVGSGAGDPEATLVLPAELSPPPEADEREGLFSGLRWGRLVVAMVAVFALAFGYLTIAEIGLGRSIAAVLNGEERGGTTISRVVDPGPAEPSTEETTEESDSGETDPTESSTESSDPTEEPTSDSEESAQPTGDPTPTSDPSSDPSGDPSSDPSGSADGAIGDANGGANAEAPGVAPEPTPGG